MEQRLPLGDTVLGGLLAKLWLDPGTPLLDLSPSPVIGMAEAWSLSHHRYWQSYAAEAAGTGNSQSAMDWRSSMFVTDTSSGIRQGRTLPHDLPPSDPKLFIGRHPNRFGEDPLDPLSAADLDDVFSLGNPTKKAVTTSGPAAGDSSAHAKPDAGGENTAPSQAAPLPSARGSFNGIEAAPVQRGLLNVLSTGLSGGPVCPITAQGVDVHLVEGNSFNLPVATSSSDPGCVSSATLQVGSRAPQPAQILDIPGGGFNVTASAVYADEEGQFTLTTRITSIDSSVTTVTSTATVDDAALLWGSEPNPPTFNWSTIPSTNQTPTLTYPGMQSSAEGSVVSLRLQANDLDGDNLTFGAVGLPPGLTISSSGLISGTVDYAAAEYGTGQYTVTAVVADGRGASDSQTFTWTVSDTPRPPVLTNPGSQTNAEGDTVWQSLSATDPDGRVLTYSASGLPPGVSLDSASGLLNGEISPTAANGSYTSNVSVSDGMFNANQTFTWTLTHMGLANPGNQSNVDGDAVSLQLQGNDVDGDIVTYNALSSLPPGLTLNASTGLISGSLTTTADVGSPYTVTISASDGASHTATQTFNWTVAHLGLAAPGSQSNADGDNVSLQLQGRDADGDTLSYSALSSLPPGLTLNPSTGLISGILSPNADLGSPYTVTVRASDPAMHSASQTFTWTVSHVGLTNPGNQTSGEGDAVSLQIQGRDHDGDALSYGANGLPSGLGINSTTGLISGTVAQGAAVSSPYTVTVTASDPAHNTATQIFTWTVIQHIAMTNPGSRNNADGDNVSLPISASDPEDGEALTYSATGLPLGLTINQNTGLISGTFALNADAGSPYTVTVTASDPAMNRASQTFTWTVSHLGLANPGGQSSANRDPVSLQLQGRDADGDVLSYSSTPLPPGLTLNPSTGLISGTVGPNADAGSPYTVTVTASDPAMNAASQTFNWIVSHVGLANPGAQSNANEDTVSLQLQGRDGDGDVLSYSSSPLPPGLTLNANTGLISGTLAATADTNSPYTVTVTASDPNNNSSSQTFTWTVVPRVTVTSPGDQLNAAGDTVSLPISASDAHGASLTYSATGLPPNLQIGMNTGVISGSIVGTADTTSPYLVNVIVSDALASTSVSFIWNVVHIAVTNPGNQTSADGAVVALQIQSRHADTTPVTYSASGLPPNLSINATTGLISGTIASNADSGSPYTVAVQATEGNFSAGQTFTWTVTPIVAANPGAQIHPAGTVVSLPIRARYYGPEPLTYTATGLPPGLMINSSTGLISGTITLPPRTWRQYNVVATVAAGTHSSRVPFTWTVTPLANPPPVITNPGSQINNEDDYITLPIQASDPDGDPLTYSQTGLPAGLSINPTTGWITGELDDGAFQTTPYTVTVSVSDGFGGTASQTFRWTFVAPYLAATGAAITGTEGTQLTNALVATFTNANVGNDEDAVDYLTTIDWGDGSPLVLADVIGSNGSYRVLGSHTYNERGSFVVTVTIAGDDLPAPIRVTTTANMADAAVTATGVPVSVLTGATTTVPVATFIDLNPNDTNYSATINWGDMTTPTSGTISGLSGKFIVYGSHPYGGHGSSTITVRIMDGGVLVATATTSATIGDFYERTQQSFSVGFLDGDHRDMPSEYITSITWGDNSSSSGTVTGSSGVFTLNDTHTYAMPRQYNVNVTISDRGGSSITSTQPIFVAEQPLTVYTASLYASAGMALNNVPVGMLTDPDPNGSLTGATIDWGDNSSGSGGVSASGGIFYVRGSHTYDLSRNYPVSLSIQPAGAPFVPAIAQAIVSLQAGQGVRPEIGSAEGIKVNVNWNITVPMPLGTRVRASFGYIPTKDIANKNLTITFLQVVLQATRGTNNIPLFPTDQGKPQDEHFKRFTTKQNPSGFLDHKIKDTDPYYGICGAEHAGPAREGIL